MKNHQLITDYINAYNKLGRFPTKGEHKILGLKSQNTYRYNGIYIGDGDFREHVYSSNPTECALCYSVLPYNKKSNTFCSKRCSATYNNPLRTKHKGSCKNCDLDLSNTQSMYCSRRCHKEHEALQRYTSFLKGEVEGLGHKSLKDCVRRRDGYLCSVCGIDEWNGDIIVLDLDHKDGNSQNNQPDNLRLLCPNCHSQTPTYKGRNSGNGRHSRRQRYKEGKSY